MTAKSVCEFALPDLIYIEMHRRHMMPHSIACPECGAPATFRDDNLAARYECIKCEHAIAAMYADAALVEMLGDDFCPPLHLATCPACGGTKAVRLRIHAPIGTAGPGVCDNQFHD